MGTSGVIFKLLGSALSLWESKESRKYLDEKIKLEKDWYEEFNKPIGKRSDAVLDDISLQLHILCDNVATAIGTKDTKAE